MTPTLEQMENEFSRHLNRYGYSTMGGDVDHIPLFHGFRILAEDYHNHLSESRRKFHRQMLEKLIHPNYPGILRPRPRDATQGGNWFSHDNHRAMLWASGVLGMSFAKDFIEHGRKHGWNWNPKDPTKKHRSGTYWRFPSLMVQAFVEAGEPVPPIYRALAYYEIKLAARVGKHPRVEKVTLPVFTYRSILKLNDPDINEQILRWKTTKLKAYPGGLGERLEKWGGPWRKSPHAKYLWDVI